jgi:hypothetical protein
VKTQEIDDFGHSFLRLALEINKHIEGYVDYYYGPDFIREEVESTSALPPDQLRDQHNHLQEILPSDDPKRHTYLVALTDAMGCTLDRLGGKKFEYREEVERQFGVLPKMVDEGEFLEVHDSLEEHIPGIGALPERIQKRNGEIRIPSTDVPKAVDLILEEIRNRSREIFEYDLNEHVQIEYVTGKPWRMDCHYLGNFQSVIRINLDVNFDPVYLTSGLIHESYPGHHTEFQTKERCLSMEKGFFEESCFPLLTPKAIISEGIANTAREIISPGKEIFEWVSEVLIPELGLSNRNAIELYEGAKARRLMFDSRANAAILYHSGKIERDEAVDYIRKYALVNRDFAEHFFQMAVDPLYRTYIFTYSEGKRMIDQATKGKHKLPLFRRMITEQFLPSDLAGAT